MSEIEITETIRDKITRKVEEAKKTHVLMFGSFGQHAFGNIIGRMRMYVDDGRMTQNQLVEAVGVFNEMVSGGRVEWIQNEQGVAVPRWIERKA